MIRIGLPPPLLPRLRLHWHATHTLFSRQARHLRESAARTAEVSREWWDHVREVWAARLSLRARAAARQRARLAEFETRYEELVDLLCWAAKDGVHTHRDERYRDCRSWMRVHYRALRPRLHAYWAEAEAPDASDPFEALFHQENIDDIINAPESISHIMQTRTALDSYRAALEDGLPKS